MNVDSILLSDYAAVDPGGKLTVVGVFNHLPAAEAPVQIAQMSVSCVVHAHSAEAGTVHKLELRLINSRREDVGMTHGVEFILPSTAPPGLPLRYVAVATILAPKFDQLGPYAFEAYIDGTYSAAVSFYVGPKT